MTNDLANITGRPAIFSKNRVQLLNTASPWPAELLRDFEAGRYDIGGRPKKVEGKEFDEPLFGTRIREAVRVLRGKS